MIEIIPAIDLIDGQCVRLVKGDFGRKSVYHNDPLKTARRFEAAGLKRLHIVDLDGARSGKIVNLDVLGRIASGTKLTIDFGGGIKTAADIRRVFDAGAAMVNIGSAAVKEPDTFFDWLDRFGADRILLGADAKDGWLAISGWQEQTQISVFALLAEYHRRGVGQAFVTDISCDGALEGPGIELYRRIRAAVPDLRLIASGGVSSIDDIRELEQIGCYGVIVGKAMYEGQIDPEELGNYQC